MQYIEITCKHKCTTNTHMRKHNSVFVDHRNEILNYEWCECVLVCMQYACFVLFHSPAFLLLLLLLLRFVFIIRRRSYYMSTLRFSIACVWSTKRSHYLCCRQNRARFLIFILFYFSSTSLVVAFVLDENKIWQKIGDKLKPNRISCSHLR